jgi:hypothetical protein
MISYFVFICFQKDQLQKQQQQLIPNGKSPERSESPNSTSTATSAGTVTPPSGKIKLQLTVVTLDLNTEALRIDILSHMYSQVVLHCACFLFVKEAMQMEELCVVDCFMKYLHENEVTFILCRV